jgi:hypothetical protein
MHWLRVQVRVRVRVWVWVWSRLLEHVSVLMLPLVVVVAFQLLLVLVWALVLVLVLVARLSFSHSIRQAAAPLIAVVLESVEQKQIQNHHPVPMKCAALEQQGPLSKQEQQEQEQEPKQEQEQEQEACVGRRTAEAGSMPRRPPPPNPLVSSPGQTCQCASTPPQLPPLPLLPSPVQAQPL